MRFVALLLLVSACVIPRGQLPTPPRDDELVSDGTPQARDALRSRYRIEIIQSPLKEPLGVRVGKAEQRATGLAGMTDPGLRTYLDADSEAGGILFHPVVETLPSLAAPLALVGLLPGPALFFTGSVLARLGDRNEPSSRIFGDHLEQVLLAAWLMMLGSVVLLLAGAALGVSVIIGLALLNLPAAWARNRAIHRFNARLDERIAANVRTTPPLTDPEQPVPTP